MLPVFRCLRIVFFSAGALKIDTWAEKTTSAHVDSSDQCGDQFHEGGQDNGKGYH